MIETKENLKQGKKYIAIGVVLFLFPIMLVVFGLWPDHSFYTLPYYGQDTIVSPEVNEEFDASGFYSLPEFEFTNHRNNAFGSDSLQGEIWLAVFYGTNSFAVKDITAQLLGINYRYRNEKGINLVCFTLDAEHDTPEVLNAYVKQNIKYNINENKWQFLTGDQALIDQYIQDAFMIDDPENTSVIWLVDPDGHLRGRYHGNDSSDMKAAVEDIALLRKEIDQKAYDAEHGK